LNADISAGNAARHMDIGWMFSRVVDFYKHFSRGVKSGEISRGSQNFSYSKLRKQPFLLKISKPRGQSPPGPSLLTTEIVTADSGKPRIFV